MPVAYDEDYYTWTQEQAALIEAGRTDQLDLENLAEEVRSLGRSEQRALASRLAILIAHLLKLQVQTTRTQSNESSWRASVKAQRNHLRRLLARNPGLKNPTVMEEALDDGWGDGWSLAVSETGLPEDRFPDRLPYRLVHERAIFQLRRAIAQERHHLRRQPFAGQRAGGYSFQASPTVP